MYMYIYIYIHIGSMTYDIVYRIYHFVHYHVRLIYHIFSHRNSSGEGGGARRGDGGAWGGK